MTDPERVELNELCSGMVDGTLSEAQRKRLQEFLRDSEEARRFYVRAMQLSASLHQYAAEMQNEAAEVEERKVVRSVQWRRWLGPLAAAAVVVFAFWLAQPAPPPKTPAAEVYDLVARVTGNRDCEWVGAGFGNGDEIAAGQQLELKDGVAELTFDSGAQMVLHAPVRLAVRSAWEAELQRGTVKANVPEEAVGFRLVNAAVEVIDLGTEFSVTAHEDGAAEVFVLKGAVEVHPRDAAGNRRGKAVLRERQARRFARAGAGDVRDREAKFAKLMQKVAINRLSKPLTYARWSFDEGEGRLARVSEPNGGALPLGIGEGTRWVAGRFGNALEFDGTFTTQAGLMGPLRRGIRSVAFWAKFPAQGTNADAVLAFPGPRAWGSWLEIGWNRTSAEGVFGAIRFETPAGTLVGSTALRDNRWHHIAVVLGAPPKNMVRPPLKLYVDGRLETFSGKSPFRRSAQQFPQETLLWLGGSPVGVDHFAGALDELVVADQPLTPQEIRHLMQSNRLLSPEAIAGL